MNWNPLYFCIVEKYIDIKNQESQKYSLPLDTHDTQSHTCSGENWEPAYLFLTYLLDLVLCSFNVVMFCNDVILESGWIRSYQMVGQGIDKFVFSVWGISKRHSIFFQFVSQVVNIPSIYVSFTTLSICSGMCCVLSELYKFVIFASDIWRY